MKKKEMPEQAEEFAENGTMTVDETEANDAQAAEKDKPAADDATAESPAAETAENGSPAKKSVKETVIAVLKYIFIDGLSGMATGLFATLIIGTIIGQIGSYIPGAFGSWVVGVGNVAKMLMGAGIALGMAYKLKKKPLVAISAGVAGMIGAYSKAILERTFTVTGGAVALTGSPGEPLGAFIAAFVALEVGSLVAGKTKVDIIVTPLVCLISGSVAGLLLGPPISALMTALGNLINVSANQQPVIMGMLVAALMGVCLTLPISSAAIGIALKLNGIAAGAAVVGCCCHMVGYAVMSFRENRWGGLIAQGIGTSMLQIPNLIKKPILWLPPVIASLILGPISAAALGMTSTAVGAGMGTSGLVGCFQTFMSMTDGGVHVGIVLTEILFFHIILPALICFILSEIMRKTKLMKFGDLQLNF